MTDGANPQQQPQQYNQPPPRGWQAPPPRTYGVPQPHFSSDTEKGVKYFSWAILLSLIQSIITFVVTLGAYMALSKLTSSTSSEQTVSTGTGALGGLSAATCGIGLLALISFILIILGVIQFNHGKNEFPGRHPSNVKLGTLSFILAILMFILLVALPIVWINSLMPASESSPPPMGLWTIIWMLALSLSFISMLATIFSGLMYLLMIKEIAKPSDRTLLYVGFILFIIAGILPLAIIMTVLPADVSNLSQSQLETLPSAIMNIPNMGYIVSSISYILFFIAYWHTKKAMEAGVIAPRGLSYPTVLPYQQAPPQPQQYQQPYPQPQQPQPQQPQQPQDQQYPPQ